MRRTFLFLVAAAAALSCGRPAAPPADAPREDLPVLLEFYSDT